MGQTYCDVAPGHEWHGPYHDREYGFPLRDDGALFERLVLEINQAGLSWLTILKKRDAFRQAYGGFDPAIVAGYGARDRRRLMNDAGIIRKPTQDRRGDGPNDVLLIFFSHSKNATVEVRMEDLKVKAINTPKYIPPAGQDEIKRAIDLARKDSKWKKIIRPEWTAIVDSSIVDSHNLILAIEYWLSPFPLRGNRQIPIYFAIVDLTDYKVLDVGSRILGRR